MTHLTIFLAILFAPLHSFTTRPATLQDLDAVYEMICELAESEGKDLTTLPVTKANLEKFGFGTSPFYHVEVAENDRGVVGYALYSFGFSGHQGKPFAYLDDLYVKPPDRNQGIGTTLLKQVAKRADEVGCCRMEWHAFEWNDKAIELYEKLGGNLRKDLWLIRLEKDAYAQLADE